MKFKTLTLNLQDLFQHIQKKTVENLGIKYLCDSITGCFPIFLEAEIIPI